ncbi:MAG: response regulator [Spirochaeta sp.]|jgi:adenylate cyclase|nr:response regulator [Spirochaeta sp.]
MSRVLLVDPSSLTQKIVREALESRGHTVSAAEDGTTAWELIGTFRPSVVITETELPGVGGTMLTRLIKDTERTTGITVIVYTGSRSGREKARSTAAGADAVVWKDSDGVDALLELIPSGADGAGDPATRGEHNADEVPKTDAGGAAAEVLTDTLARTYERTLFRAQVLQQVWEVGEYLPSLPQTVEVLLETVGRVFELDIAAAILRFEREARVFVLPGARTFSSDVDDFVQIARDDFSRRPGTEMVQSTRQIVLGTDARDDYAHVRIDGKRISSYHILVLIDTADRFVGLLHLGHLSNNFFTGQINDDLEALTRPVGTVLSNSVRYNETEERRRKINTIFSKFVPVEVIEDLLSQSEDAEMAVGEKRDVAILFTDIRSFTVISEHNTAENIVSFLNAYLEQMVRIIRRHGGYVDKFIGDAILAIFGAPISYQDNAVRAVRAAQEMAATVSEIDVEGLVLPDGGFTTGIGVHEGTVIVGNIGSRDKFDYTVIGDNVNLSSRLEGLTKHYRTQVLMSDTVHRKVTAEIETREVDTVRVKGKEQATTLYSTVPAGSFDEESARNYHKALSMYRLGNWTIAIDYFRRVLERYPTDYLASMYITRCREFADDPPDENWGGAITLDFK